VQWRTLAAGLQLSSTHGTIQVHDLLDAFNATSPPKPARAPVARNAPIAKKKARSWTLVAAAAFLCGAGAVIAMTLLGIQPIDARYIDLARESGFMQFVQSAPGDPKDAAGIRKAVTPATSPDVDSVPTNLVAELPVAASRQVSDANESDTSVPGLADGDVGRTNGLRAAPVDDSELVIGASSPEDVMAATTAGIPGFQLGSAEYSIEENGQALAVEIYRQGNLSIPASVELTTYSVSAESGVDFANFERHEIRFAAGEASKTIFVPIVADATPEGSEVFRIALGNSLGEMILTEGAIATVIILDDDV
jgi:hypothetical protein